MRGKQAVGVLATLVVLAASAAMNFTFLRSLGSDAASGLLLGVMGVALDVLKAMLPLFAAASWAAGAWSKWLVQIVLLILLMVLGFTSAVGFGAEQRGAAVDSREGLNAALAGVERDLAATRASLAGMGEVRAPAVVEAALAAALAAPVRSATKVLGTLDKVSEGCGKPGALTAAACAEVGSLKTELAGAVEAARLRTRAAELESEGLALRARGGGGDSDRQASALAVIVSRVVPGADAGWVRTMIVWLVAGLIEAISALGLWAVDMGERRLSRRLIDVTPAAPGEAPSVLPAPALLPVATWAKERLDFVEDGRLLLGDALADYRRLAQARGLGMVADRTFRRSLMGAVLDLGYEVYGDELRGVVLEPQASVPVSAPGSVDG